MPLITDPDDLTDGAVGGGTTEVEIDPATKTIKLNIAGNLSTDGVTLKAIYSFLKEEWRNDPNAKILTAYPFPMVPITDESFEFIAGWALADVTSNNLIRTAGWTVRNTAGASIAEYAGIIGLGDVESDDQIYYDQSAGATNAVLTGQINQAVQIMSDPNGDGSFTGGFDYRNTFNLFVREQGQIFGQATLADIGVVTMAPQAYRFPLSTAIDLKITNDDSVLDPGATGVPTVAPYSGMSITYHETPQTFDIGGTNRDFGIVIDANGGTAEEVYEFVQFMLRQSLDADASADSPVQIGNISDELLRFVGDQLQTLNATNTDGGGTGVYIDGFQAVDESRLQFQDNTEVARAFPFNAVLTLSFNDNLVADPDSKFWVYMSDPNGTASDGDEWDTAGAVLLQDVNGIDITGDVSGATTSQHTIAYDSNSQASHTPGTDIDVTVVAQGLNIAQYVRATGTVQRSISNQVSLVSPLERNYENV